ncbi:hypothetical protein A2524_01025 [Candidatus Wolfebacteria bacterium RIFOXYD12_FULL_48_21]|uniref:Uncharacterized protein n=1 Tax=Candidatus Wolfebacteria bacterium RIFOXYD1_FULL_48_65 TaxID=1802561 RepID=A0A1F8E207_9BACT|nr:MAG: hypothetical protein A2610_02970 [Candidatus Wolfebacteria bacterium RIFOXYD1_FULL_48_65]OGM94391.1 MAG: hypothetical protein A2524_01025 [Candidatus Wolfebacteria bacterium RIFOXYD12_FULL_48_21]
MAEEDENILASGKSVAEELIFTLSRLIKSKGGSSFEDLLYLVSPDGLAFLDDLASQIVEYRRELLTRGVAPVGVPDGVMVSQPAAQQQGTEMPGFLF